LNDYRGVEVTGSFEYSIYGISTNHIYCWDSKVFLIGVVEKFLHFLTKKYAWSEFSFDLAHFV